MQRVEQWKGRGTANGLRVEAVGCATTFDLTSPLLCGPSTCALQEANLMSLKRSELRHPGWMPMPMQIVQLLHRALQHHI